MSENPFNMLMKQAQQMQQNIQKAQEDLAKMKVTGSAGGGMVIVVLNGRYDAEKVTLDPSALQESKETLEGLIAAAFNDAARKVEAGAKGKMSGLMSGLNLPEGFQMPPMGGGSTTSGG